MTTKEEVQALQRVIQVAQDQIEAIRKECKHESLGEYSYANERPPNYEIAELCNDCGKYHRYLRPMEWSNKVTLSGPRELTQEEINTLGEEQLRLEKEWEQQKQL